MDTDAAPLPGDALLDELAESVKGVLAADRKRLRRRFKRYKSDVRRRPAADFRRRGEILLASMKQSAAIKARREAAPIVVAYPEALPVSQHVDALKRLIEANQVVVIGGATGSGKSTQLAKLCLELERGVERQIGHTQPRRISARAIAARIAAETSTSVGEWIGYNVRFDDRRAPHSRLILMTDGILLNEINGDPLLEKYDTLIIDEVHERTLNIDVILGHLKRILVRRRDLKVIITSATLDLEVITNHFEGCATFEIAGRQYPVETRYRPIDEQYEDLSSAVAGAIRELDAEPPGDVLVFLPGEREIQDAAKALQHSDFSDREVLKLYSRLPQHQQDRIFQPRGRKRIVLATNVAETSLTVPGIRYVVDSGLARISRYSLKRKLQQLAPEPINRASANQRQGRCGRTAPGICIRLYDEADFDRRRISVEPEVLRTNLAEVILRLKAVGIESIETFPFPQPPQSRVIKDGYNVLHEIGAIDGERRLTAIGRTLSALPIDPRLGRIIVAAIDHDCVKEVLVIVSALSVSDPRDRPRDVRELADRAHKRYADTRSDFMWFVKAWDDVRKLVELPRNRRQRACRRLFLSVARVSEWVRVHDELAERLRQDGITLNAEAATYKRIHCAILSGFPALVGEWRDDRYQGCRETQFLAHPSSVLHRRNPKWVAAAEVIDSGRPYARLVARIEPRWITETLAHLIRRDYSPGLWDERRGCARVTEVQRLFGLIISADRQVDLQRIDAMQARAIMIRDGLVDYRLGQMPSFLTRNLQTLTRLRRLEARVRRRDIVVSADELSAFYDERIPGAICTRKGLLRWLRETPGAHALLTLSERDATLENRPDVPGYLFPDAIDIDGNRCLLDYRFEPDHIEDGLTVAVPLVLLPRVRAEHVDRLVPGLLPEKVEALMRGLPKQLRRKLTPIGDFSVAVTEAIESMAGDLCDAVSAAIKKITAVDIEPAILRAVTLPTHLNAMVAVVDEQGNRLGRDRELPRLQENLGQEAADALSGLGWGVADLSSRRWDFGALPDRIERDWQGATLVAYCGLAVEATDVRIKVFEQCDEARDSHRAAVIELLLNHVQPEIRTLTRLEQYDPIHLTAVSFGHTESVAGVFVRARARSVVTGAGEIRNEHAFGKLLDTFKAGLLAAVESRLERFETLLRRAWQIHEDVRDINAAVSERIIADIDSHLGALVGPHALAEIDQDLAPEFDRYFQALERRVERIASNPGKDLEKLTEVAALWNEFTSR
ncbi:MAG: ATP-dependent RNA helicase HrpA, partial [Gammaproteobacteria bacterium]